MTCTAGSQGSSRGGVVRLSCEAAPRAYPVDMTLLVLHGSTGRTYELESDAKTKVSKVQTALENLTGVPFEQQILVIGGQKLDSDRCFGHYAEVGPFPGRALMGAPRSLAICSLFFRSFACNYRGGSCCSVRVFVILVVGCLSICCM